MTKLTKRAVESASVQDKTYCLWDDELRGFGLRVWPTGHKVYLVKCRVKGRQRFITLGPHGVDYHLKLTQVSHREVTHL